MGRALELLGKVYPAGGQVRAGQQMARKYEGADRGRRFGSFPLNRMSPNRDIGMDAAVLRERANYLYQNTHTGKRSINSLANGIVGTGILPTFKTADAKALAILKRAWRMFGETIMCDFNGRLTYSGVQKLATKMYKREGEVIILRRRVPANESIIGMQYQVISMDYLATHVNYQQLANGGYTMDGIEYDKRGKVVAYWLHQRHPSDWYTQPVRVMLEDLIHLLHVDYAGQNRGVPSAAPVILPQRDLDEYEDAELMGKKVQAAHAVFRVTNNLDPDADIDENDYDSDEDLERVEPGMIYKLTPGEDIKFNTPPAAPGAEEFRKAKYRGIAAGYEVTYEMMTGDYSNVNFSSGRMGWIEHQRTIDDDQWLTVVPQFCNKSMVWFLEGVLLMQGGLVKLPDDLEVEWTTPRREMLDPVKETDAMLNLMRMGGKSWSEAVSEMGYNPDDVLAAYVRDKAAWEKAGLKAEWSVDLVPSLKGGGASGASAGNNAGSGGA